VSSEKPQATDDVSSANSSKNEPDHEGSSLERRDYLRAAGVSGIVLGGLGLGLSSTAAGTTVPPGSGDWELQFEDDFEGDSLDTSNWGLGWGWGLGAPGAKVSWARDRHVTVSDSMLRLTASHEDYESDDVIYVGAVHSKNMVTVEPPVYFEARCKFIQGVGWQNAFWSKPNTEDWPPEIDVVEYLQPYASRADETSHNLHYSASGEPGDSSTHQTVNGSYEGYESESDWPGNAFHTYGVEWREGAIRHYVDGTLVEETTDPDVLESFNRGGPEYLMLSLNLDNVGTTDKSVSWEGREFLCDWVRVWDYAPDSGTETTTTTTGDGSDDSSDDSTESHYIWLRSATGDPATFAFEVSGGSIRFDSSGQDADYWISDDGTVAGGTVARQSQLPGLRFEGSITDLTYEGPLEIYLDDEQVDPDTYVDESEPGPYNPDAYDTIIVDGGGHDGSASYSITVEEEIRPGKPMNGEDDITDRTATGTVGSGSDEYEFVGEITALSLDGDATVTVDGTRLDRLTVERADGSSGSVPYLIELDGTVEGISPSATDEESVTATEIFGTADGEPDYFWLDASTTIVDVSAFDGSVDTYRNGTLVDRTD